MKKRWNFEDVAKVLSDKRTNKELAHEMGRTVSSVDQARSLATVFKNGKGSEYISESMRKHYTRYFQNQGNMQLKEVSTPVEHPAVHVDLCAQQIEELIKQSESLFDQLKQDMAQLATVQARHQTHTITDQLSEAKKQLTENSEELESLRKLREDAEQKGFGKMLRTLRPF